MATLRWTHQFSPQLFSETATYYTGYHMDIGYDTQVLESSFRISLRSGIQDWGLRTELEYYPNPDLSLRAGYQGIRHQATPSLYAVADTLREREVQQGAALTSWEQGFYAEAHWTPGSRLRLQGGLRLSHFMTDSLHFWRPEPRLSMAYTWGHHWAAKASYTAMNQYMHLLSQSSIGMPTDLWVPTTQGLAPQRAQQWALGLVKDLPQQQVSISLEAYYKTMDQILTYRPGAQYIVLDDPESLRPVDWAATVTAGSGWASGAELLLQKQAGALTGWLGYTLAWIRERYPEIQQGQPVWGRYDTRHDVALAVQYRMNPRWSFSGNWTLRTGQVNTLPLYGYFALHFSPKLLDRDDSGFQDIRGSDAYDWFHTRYFTFRNFRTEAYHRLDLGVEHRRKGKWASHVWNLSVYNAYNRANPLFYAVETREALPPKPSEGLLVRVSLFPLIPSVRYTFEF